MAEVAVDVGVRLQVMQSSVAELQRVLDKLAPNSSGFKNLQKIITSITADVEKLQTQTTKGFSSQSDFSKANKTVDKLEESLIRAQNVMSNIKFSDLKLTPDQENVFQGFEQELIDIENRVKEFKNNLKNALTNDQNTRDWIVSNLNTKALDSDLDALAKSVDTKVDAITDKYEKLKIKQQELQNSLNKNQNVARSIADSGVTPETIGADLFDKYIEQTAKGARWKGGISGFGGGEARKQFLQELQQMFHLDESEIQKLVDSNGTFKQINEALQKSFQTMFSGEQTTGAALGVEQYIESLSAAIQKSSGELMSSEQAYTAAQAVARTFATALEQARAAEAEAGAEADVVSGKVQGFSSSLVDNVRASSEAKNGLSSMSSELQRFQQELDRSEASMLKLQAQERTFNSIKAAITNFMGFNQVLNLTKRAVKEAANHIKELDSTMNSIAIVSNELTTADLWSQVSDYSKIAQTYGTSIQGAYEVSKIYYQAGYETTEVMELMNESLKLAKISGLDYASTTDYMMTA